MPLVQQDRLVSLATPLGRDVLHVETLEGTEAMSGLFRFQLVLVSEKKSLALTDLVGQRVTLSLEQAGKKQRFINGFVSCFSQGDVDARVSYYYAEVVPWVWFLTRRSNCRIFQKKTVPDIVQFIFKELGYTEFRVQFQGSFEPREYCVQYRETDFAFVSRLLEEEGIFYFFEHTDSKHTLVLSNDPNIHQPCPGMAQARYGYLFGGNQDRDLVTRWHLEQEVQPAKYTLADYYFQTPSNGLRVSAPTAVKLAGIDKLEIYDYPGSFAKRFDGDDKAGKVRPDGERTVKLHMQGPEALHKVVSGAGGCRGLIPGYKFELAEHRRAELNGPYVVTQVNHAVTNNLGDGEGCSYENTFTCIPQAVPFRPARSTPRPLIYGAQTAVVVGLPGEEIDTDKYGRVKVQFHWDREGKKDHNSSVWVRVATLWAGKGWGTVNIPRIGQEVVVTFLEGDPDQPLIIGSVYNAEQMPPFQLPQNKMVAGLKTNSTPGGGGFNEMSMNDTKGKELINIHGQYDMNTKVKHDQTNTVDNVRQTKIGVDDNEEVGCNQTIKIGATQKLEVGGDRENTIKGNQKSKIGCDQKHEVGGAQKETVGAGRSIEVGGNDSLTVGGAQKIDVGKAIEIVAGNKITLIVGGSSIVIESGGITLHTKGTIKVGGDTKVEAKGGEIICEAKGDNTIKGKMVKLN